MVNRICDRITDDDCRVKEGGDKEGYYSFAAECGMLWLKMTKEEKEKIIRSHELSKKTGTGITKEEKEEWIDLLEWGQFHGIDDAVIPENKRK